MRLHRPVIRRAQRTGGRGERCGVADALQHVVAHEGPALHALAHTVAADERAALRPAHLQLARRAHRGPFVFGDHGDEILEADHARALQVRDRLIVDLDRLRADRRRPQRAAVQHLGQADVVHEGVLAVQLVGQVGARQRAADDAVIGGLLQRRLRVHRHAERLARVQVGDSHRCLPVDAVDHAIGQAQRVGRTRELARSARDHRLARGRRGLAQLHAAAHHAGAAGGRALIRRERGVAFDQLDAIDTEIELLGDHLAHRDAVAGAEVDLAGVDDHAAVALEREECIDRVELQRAAVGRTRAGVRGRRLRDTERQPRHADDERAVAQEMAARHCSDVHDQLLAFGFVPGLAGAGVAARCTARSTRSCDPQRHRWPANAACVCSRVGFGVLRNNATVAITMPLLQ